MGLEDSAQVDGVLLDCSDSGPFVRVATAGVGTHLEHDAALVHGRMGRVHEQDDQNAHGHVQCESDDEAGSPHRVIGLQRRGTMNNLEQRGPEFLVGASCRPTLSQLSLVWWVWVARVLWPRLALGYLEDRMIIRPHCLPVRVCVQ